MVTTGVALALAIYFYTHYAFATVTVHVLAMFAPFVTLVIGLGAPPKLAVYAFACLAALPAGLTHYGTTTAPMFINGYVSREDAIDTLWDGAATSNLVDRYIGRLREKLSAPDIIRTVRGVGFMLDV